jgi:hypothetical protein
VGIKEAKKKLTLARSQLERVQSACWDPSDAIEAVTFAFYAYENALEAVTEARGEKFTRKHWEKSKIAGNLKKKGILSLDIEKRLCDLNDLRKSVSYGEPGPALQELDLEELATQLENFIDEVENIVSSAEE